jgi:hypothetical protein
MSYASLASPTLPPLRLPVDALHRHARMVLALVGATIQCLIVAATLWTLLAAPGLITDRNSTATATHR